MAYITKINGKDVKDAKASQDIADLKSQITTKASVDMALGAYPTDTVSGGVASFGDGANGIPVKDLTIAIEPVQSGNGDPSPDNVRPISGWTEANVTQMRKNVLNLTLDNVYQGGGGMLRPADYADNVVEIVNNGVKNTNRNRSYGLLFYVGYIKAGMVLTAAYGTRVGGGNLTVRYTTTQPAAVVAYTVVSSVTIGNNWTQFTAPVDGYYYIGCYANDTNDITLTDLMVYFGAHDGSVWQPYVAPTTIPITFPTEAGTVYGGTLDMTTGVLTVDRAFTTIGDCAWSLVTNYTYTQMFGTRSVMQLIDKSLDTVNKAKGLRCSIFKSVGRNYQYSHRNDNESANTIAITTMGELYIASGGASTYADAAEFKAALSDTQLIYPLATPRTYQLDSIEVLTLLGANTIYADTGDITFTYRADPTLYADKRVNATRSIIAGIEPTMTASKAYTAGQLLIVGDTLYKVAASIASGATLTPGTNVNPTTVAEQLILLANA